MQISLSFQMPIRIWSYSEKQTDNSWEIYSKLLAHSEQIHSARDIYPVIFCWFDKIYVKILLIWLRFWTAGWRLSFWEMDIFGSLILIFCAPVRTCITSLLDMAVNFNWFIKITRSFGSGFQNQHIAKPEGRLIIIENRSELRFIPDQIKEHFGLWTTTHSLTIVFFCMLILCL